MVDPLTALTLSVSKLSLGLRLVDGISKLTQLALDATGASTGTDVGRVYDKVRALMAERAILGSSQSFEMKTTEGDEKLLPVESPLLTALCGLYGNANRSGKVYVLYDKPGKGKTAACVALLRSFYGLSNNKKIQGFMVPSEGFADDVMGHLCVQLEAESVDGWIHAMLLAMNQPQTDFPSILILDGFNSPGKDDANMNFIQGLYREMNGKKNIFVVVVTQKKEIATRLCQLNGGCRVSPLPGCYNGDNKTDPDWKEEPWERNLLVQVVHYDCPGVFSKEEGDGRMPLDFVEEGMTPLEVIMDARTRLRPTHFPSSPKKQKVAH